MNVANMSREALEAKYYGLEKHIKTINLQKKKLAQQNRELRTLVRFYREKYPESDPEAK